MLKKNILCLANACQLLFQTFIIKELVYLEADLRIFIRIERCDTGFGGTERLAAQTLLLILIEQNMIWHNHLCSVRDQDLRCRYTFAYNFIVFLEKYRDIKSNTVADNACGVSVEYT